MKGRLLVLIGLIAGFACTTQLGCASRRTPQAAVGLSNGGTVWTRDEALGVLERAAASTDVTIRALAISALVESSAEDGWLERGWLDPSPTVQRGMARKHAHRLSREHVSRVSADRLAIALTLVDRRAEVGAWDSLPEHFEKDELIAALLGEPSVLLADVRDGMIPPEPLFVEVLLRSKIEGLGDALADGALQAEEDMQLPMALAAFQLVPEKGEQALIDVLRETDEITKVFAVESLSLLGNDKAAVWLKRVAKSDNIYVRDHARLGLVALGLASVDVAIQGLSASDRDQRAWAATCLKITSQNRPLPREAIVALQVAWRDESMMVRQAVTQALIDGAGVEFVPLGPVSTDVGLDAVSVLVAAKWFSLHQQGEPDQAEK